MCSLLSGHPSTALQAGSLSSSAAFTLTFSGGKRLWFLAAMCLLLTVKLLCPSLSLMHKIQCPMGKPVPARLIWIKDVFWFSLFHKARENLHYPELGGRFMCVFSTRLSLGLFHIRSLQSCSGCRLIPFSSEIQSSHAKFPLFFASQDPLTGRVRLWQTLRTVLLPLCCPTPQICFLNHPVPCCHCCGVPVWGHNQDHSKESPG